MSNLIVGLTGQFGAGCTTIADFLEKEFNFKRYSFSEILIPAARERLGEEVYDRYTLKDRRGCLQDQGDILRVSDKFALAKEVIRQIKANRDQRKDIVVEAFRNPAEVEAFRDKFKDFFLLAIDAPSKERFERLHGVYGNDLQQFEEDDLRDKGDDEPVYGQHTEDCVYLADISINNHQHIELKRDWDKFFIRVRTYVGLMREPARRMPTYEELYMRQAYALSLKSGCTKRKVGAIIVREIGSNEASNGEATKDVKSKREVRQSYGIAAGYNTVPLGEEACSEKGSRDDTRFCPKDEAEEEKLRAMSYCPSCGTELSFPPERIRNFRCPNCAVRLPKHFTPGKLLDTCIAVHAEEAAILQAANLGSSSLKNTTLYTTTFPCLLCAKSIINSGIKKVVYHEPYPMDESWKILRNCGVTLQKHAGVNAWAFDRLFRGVLD